MSAGVARPIRHEGTAVRRRGLRKSGECIEFAHDPDDWLAFAELRDKRGRDVSYACLNTKTRRLQLTLQQS